MRTLLFIVLSLCTVLPISLLGFSQARRLAVNELRGTDRQALAAAQAAANQLSVAMLGYVHAAESFSAQLEARNRLDRETLESVMEAHRASHSQFLGSYVADKDGVALLNQMGRGKFLETQLNYADRDYYSKLIETKRAVVSRAAIGRMTRVLSVQIVAPIFDRQHTLVGFTCSSVDLGTMPIKRSNRYAAWKTVESSLLTARGS